MELKNITSYDHFRRVYEGSLPDEFKNTTGFRQSLVGRAVFGIFRYFKKGINLGRLEFYKRRLENEYFAGLLRFAAVTDLDLLTGMMPTGQTSGSTPTPAPSPGPNPDEIEFCNVLGIDFTEPDNINKLKAHLNLFSGHTAQLEQVLAAGGLSPDDEQQCKDFLELSKKVVICCQAKLQINPVFQQLHTLSGSTDPAVGGLLDQIKTFLESDAAKYCSTYHGTDSEKMLIRDFENSSDAGIKTKFDEISPLLDSFSFYDDVQYELIEEKITSGLNKMIPITQVLGDQLNQPGAPQMKVNVYDWLKSKGISDPNKINWDALQKLFAAHPEYQNQATKYVNKDGIKKIQYAVSKIIFHTKAVPPGMGTTPETGGGAMWEQDTSLRTSWEKKVEFVKSEFANFFGDNLNIRELDPFQLLNYSDALRKRDYGKDGVVATAASTVNGIANNVAIDSIANKIGLVPLGNEDIKNEGNLYVFSMTYQGNLIYPVFQLKGGDKSPKVYRYIGNLNLQKILDDKAYEKADFDKNANKYATPIWQKSKADSDKTAITALKLDGPPPPPTSFPNFTFEGMSLTKSDYNRFTSYKDSPRLNISVRFLYIFAPNANMSGTYTKINGIPTDFKIQYLFNNKLNNITDNKKILTETKGTQPKISLSEAYRIESSWEDIYFNDGFLTTYKNNPPLFEKPFLGVIDLKG